MNVGIFSYVIDAYDRRARLYPALLCFLPAIAVAVGVYSQEFTLNKGLISIAMSFGVVSLLISVARDTGKKREPVLFADWGGKPSIQLLRHRDTTVDTVTKKAYHDFLSKHLATPFPTPADEIQDPRAADDKYEAATRWLIERTRDIKKFPFIFRENVNYGFRRSCPGLKPLGMLGSVIGIVWTLGAIGALGKNGITWQHLETATVGAKVSLLTCILLLVMWSVYITPASVRRVAFVYADMLLRACDKLPKKRS